MILRRRYKLSSAASSIYTELEYLDNTSETGMPLNTKVMNNLYGFEIKFKCNQNDLDLVASANKQISICAMYGVKSEDVQQTYTRLYLRKRNDVAYFTVQLNEGIYTYPAGHAKEGQQTINSSAYYMLGESDTNVHTVRIINHASDSRYHVYMDSTLKGYRASAKVNENPVLEGVDYLLFNGTPTTPTINGKTRIYYFKAYDDQLNVIAYLMPVKRNRDNMLGLYDIINDVFYGDLFTAGPEVSYDAEIEYLESTGTLYIDTGYIPIGNDIKIEGKYYLDSYTASYGAWLSTYANESTETYRIIRNNTNDNSVYFNCGVNASAVTAANVQSGNIYTYELTYNGLVLNNTITESFLTAITNTNTNSLYLFALPDGTRTSIGRHYYLKVYKNNVLVRDMIPVRKDGVGYMFDKITKRLFGNIGTGSFVLGNDVVL